MAVTRDCNKNIFPIAFAIAEGEKINTWHFFLEHLCTNVTPQEGICCISGRHEATKGSF